MLQRQKVLPGLAFQGRLPQKIGGVINRQRRDIYRIKRIEKPTPSKPRDPLAAFEQGAGRGPAHQDQNLRRDEGITRLRGRISSVCHSDHRDGDRGPENSMHNPLLTHQWFGRAVMQDGRIRTANMLHGNLKTCRVWLIFP